MDPIHTTAVVVRRTQRCNILLKELVSVVSSPQESEYHTVRSYQVRFDFWAASLNILVEKKLGLEQPIRAAPLLALVEGNLRLRKCSPNQTASQSQLTLGNEVLNLEKARREPKLAGNDSSFKFTQLASLKAVGESIKRLHDLAFMFTNPQFTSEPILDPYTKLLVSSLVKSRFPRLSQQLSERLTDAVVIRSQRVTPNSISTTWNRAATEYQNQDHSLYETESAISVTQPPPSEIHRYPDYVYEDDANYAEKRAKETGESRDPTSSPGISRRQFIEDLQPYVCLLECKPPQIFFSRFHDWQYHMESVHGRRWIRHLQKRERWFCDISHCTASSQRFRTVGELQLHVENVHAGNVFPAQLDSMMKRNVVVARGDANICPICYRDVRLDDTHTAADGLDVEDNWLSDLGTDGEEDTFSEDDDSDDECSVETYTVTTLQQAVAKHIATDLKSLAFLSLQYWTTKAGHSHSSPSGIKGDNKPLPQESATTSCSNAVEEAKSDRSELGSLVNNGEESPLSRPPSADQLQPAETKMALVGPRSSSPKATSPSLSILEEYSLENSLFENLCESVFDHGRQFVPKGTLEKVFTIKNIRRELQEWGEFADSNVDYIFEKATKLFAILLYMGMDPVMTIPKFQDCHLTDQCLPVPRTVFDCVGGGNRVCNHEPCFDAFHHRPWSLSRIHRLLDSQWIFLAPVLSSENPDQELSPQAILPIVKIGPNTRTGFFSDLYEVYIHPDHCQGLFPTAQGVGTLGSYPRAALKELRAIAHDDDATPMAAQEMQSLRALRMVRNDCLINSISTIVRGTRRFVLFPWADGGNLRDFWMTNDIRPLTSDQIRDSLQALMGLSNALHQLHESSWRHGDIKPENILRFMDGTVLGVLKLGDLGLAKRHHESTMLRNNQTTTTTSTPRYEAPEAYVSFTEPRSRLYDIWSMGCLILEFILWLRYGPDGLRHFNDCLWDNGQFNVSFYSSTKTAPGEIRATVNPAVQAQLEHLSADPFWTRDTALGELVALVSNDLLVVDLPRSSQESETLEAIEIQGPSIQSPAVRITSPTLINLRPERRVRANSRALKDALGRIYEKSCARADYLFPTRTDVLPLEPLWIHKDSAPDVSNILDALGTD